MNKNEKPDISIIIPIYNVEKYISKCINSILNQTFKNFELILINDGSNDSSGDICNEYAKKDNRIKVFHQKNKGVSATRNYGINIAQGKYLMFCDSDDYVESNWCEELYNAILEYPNAWINCNIVFVDYETNKIYKIDNLLQEKEYLSKEDYYITVQMRISGNSCNKIFDKEKLDKYNIRFNEKNSLGEDVEFTIDYLKITDNILIINKFLYYYVKYPNETLSTRKYENHFELLKHFYNLRKPFVKKEYLEEFYSVYFYSFSKALTDKLNSTNTSLFQRLKYNQKAINTPEFIECLRNSRDYAADKKYKQLLKSKNYYIVYMFQKILNIKKVNKK